MTECDFSHVSSMCRLSSRPNSSIGYLSILGTFLPYQKSIVNPMAAVKGNSMQVDATLIGTYLLIDAMTDLVSAGSLVHLT